MNDLVDRLCVEAAATQRPRSGDTPPTELGPADSFGTEAGAHGVGPAPGRPYDGWAVLVGGQRPPGFDTDGDPAGAGDVVDTLIGALAGLVEDHPDAVVVTGLRRGTEQLGAEAAVGAGLAYVAVLPWPDPAAAWPDDHRERFEELVDEADSTVVLDHAAPDSRQGQVASMARREDWLARHVDAAVIVWDGVDEVVGRQYRSLVDHLGHDAVDVVGVVPAESATRRARASRGPAGG